MLNQYSLTKALQEFSINLPSQVAEKSTGDLVNDTRKLKPLDIFCAVKGHQDDGRIYIEQAIELGVNFVISQCVDIDEHGQVEVKHLTQGEQARTVSIIHFYQLDFHLFALAKAYYQSPQSSMKVIGVTGTNGKTSCCQLIASLLGECQEKTAVIGTTGAGALSNLTPIENTTPGATQLHQLLASFKAQNFTSVAMEVSSHALDQRRVHADLFDIALFTNISRDHLDYHKSMANYADAKFQIFANKENQQAIINYDDAQAQKWLNTWPEEKNLMVYGCSDEVTSYPKFAQAKNIEYSEEGSQFLLNSHVGEMVIATSLMGKFNIYNLLAAISVLMELNISLAKIKSAVLTCKSIVGRMEVFSAPEKPTAIVDYAHTPDALLNALQACRSHCKGTLWVIFGCGGDRDKGKRSLMGRVAQTHADHIVLTNDNPRNENPSMIIEDILAGCVATENIKINQNREMAIKETLAQAKENDMVLIAGKGHETFIYIGDKKIPYNERQFVQSTYTAEALS